MKKLISIILTASILLSMTGCGVYQGGFDTITPEIRKNVEDGIGKIPTDYQEQVKALHVKSMGTEKDWKYKFLGKPRPTMLPALIFFTYQWAYMGHFIVSFMDDGAIETENWCFLVHSGKVIDVQEAVLLSDSRAAELEKKYAEAERRDAEAAKANAENSVAAKANTAKTKGE